MICPKCKKTIKDGAKFCGFCGKKFTPVPKPAPLPPPVPTPVSTPVVQETVVVAPKPTVNDENVAKCPKCGSTSLQAQKEGVKVGRAVAGALLVGPLGLAAGAIGANNVQVVCLKCGHKFKPR